MATSASRTSVSADAAPSLTTIPIEALTTTGRSPTTTGASKRRQQPLGDLDRPALAGQPLAQQRELVAAHPRERVALVHQRAEPQRDLGQQLVAARVPERVVDELEAVDVEHQHGDRAAVARGQRERVVHAVDEQRAVRQPGERVVQRAVPDLLLQGDDPPQRVVQTRLVGQRLGIHAVAVAASGSSWFISAQKAATTMGSNWRPAQRHSSSKAVAAGSASRYGRGEVMAS